MREFRYDDARARYLSADYPVVLQPEDQQPQPATLPYAGTDYLGVMPAGDAEIDYDAQSQTWSVEDNTLYLVGIAGQQDATTEEVQYFHSDLLGSTSLVTDDDGERVRYGDCSTTGQLVSYTAFGEYVALTATPDPNDPNAVIWSAAIGGDLPAGFPRYGYAAHYGYESGLLAVNGPNTNFPPLALQHLGWRWYDPGIGRFVQRDPIGIAGGRNSYAYVHASPSMSVDPTELVTDDYLNRERIHKYIGIGLPPPPAGRIVGEITCRRVPKHLVHPGQVRGTNWLVDKLRRVVPGQYVVFRWCARYVLPWLCIAYDTIQIPGDSPRFRPEDLADPNGFDM
jgi:hypothetical protein